MADDDNTAPDLWEELKRRSTALTKRDRRKYEAGEHERLWDALYSIYVLRLPMSDWLYEAVMEWMHRTETPRQRQKRNQRTTDAGRALTVLSKWPKGKKNGKPRDRAITDATEHLQRIEPGITWSAVEDSYNKFRKRDEYWGRRKKGPD